LELVTTEVGAITAMLTTRHWCSLIKGEKRYGVRLRGNGEIIKT
jgi:hypothetical protein